MKSLQVLPALEVGGVERGVIDLARAARQRGHEMVVVSSGGALVAQLHKFGIAHYALPVHRKSPFSLSLVDKIVDIIHREHIDVVHGRSRVPAWLAWLAARRAKVPFVTTCHGYYSNHPLSRVMGWGKRVIVISRTIGRHMVDDFGVPPEKIRLIHRGIDLSQFPFQSSKYENKPRIPRIINIGRFSPIKGQVEFLKAVHLLRRECPQLEVWLVGGEGKGKTKYTQLIRQTIHQLGLDACVKLLGVRRDIPELLVQADLLVLSTLVPEAFGRVILEAGAVGTAVVATRVGGVVDILDGMNDGTLVAPGDLRAMASAMHESLCDLDKSRLQVRCLREKIEKNFTLEQMASRTFEVYDEVKREKRILFIKLGAMGDLVLATPSFRMMRRRFPEARISLLVDKRLGSLVSLCPYLDERISVDRKRLPRFCSLLKMAKLIRREDFDISVDLQNSKWTHLLAFLAGIPMRLGFGRGPFGFLLNRPEKGFHAAEAPVKNQFRILSKLGVTKMEDRLELWPDPDSQKKVRVLLGAELLKPEVMKVGFVMGSSAQWPTKRWPAESFEKLARRLMDEYKCRIVLLGTSSEREQAAEVLKLESPEILDWIGKTSPQELCALIRELDVVVTGDTAPLHVAAAVGIPVVALFGPTDPLRHMPPADHASVLTRHLPCRPCYQGECRYTENLACLRRISVDEVFEAVKKHWMHSKESLETQAVS